jgi:nicotinate phosphoribosyltransferase
MISTALLTDKYEFTMLDASIQDRTFNIKCTFEVFSNKIAGGRPYGVFAGSGRLLEEIKNFRFTADQLDYLSSFLSKNAIDYLQDFKFTGNVFGYKEGELYFEKSPVLQVSGTFAECTLLETLVLSVLNYDSAVATAASRITSAAAGRTCYDMGARRTHEAAAIAAARASYIAGFEGTSCMQAGLEYNIPTIGTVAHSFILLHKTQLDAFKSQINTLGLNTTLLVDTYNVEDAIKSAIKTFGTRVNSIRLDSGNLLDVAIKSRKLLDNLGAYTTKIIATSDLDEYSIKKLQNSPIDYYGIGTKLVTGSGVPTAEFVYKLVEKTVGNSKKVGTHKKSHGKETTPYKKYAYRVLDNNHMALSENLYNEPQNESGIFRKLFVQYIKNGAYNRNYYGQLGIINAKQHYRTVIKELPKEAFNLKLLNKPAIFTRVYF